MASTAVVFDILARDRASDKFDHFGKSVSGSSSKLSKLTGIAKTAGKAVALGLGAGLVLATGAGVKFAQAAAADEQAAKLLEGALKRNAGATDEQVASVENWITEIGRAKGVADDDLRPALSRLVTATGDVTQAQLLAQVAMDVSAGSGKSLEAVSTALMKAQNGQVSSLSRLGINTKNAKGETIGMKEAVERMSEQFGGAASEKAQTLQGKMGRLKVIFDETKEAIGARLIPIVSDFADVLLKKVIPNIGPVASKLGNIAKIGWSKLSGAASAIKDFFQSSKGHKALATSMEAIETAASGMKSAFTKVKDAIAGIDLGNLDSKEIGTKLGEAVAAGLDTLLSLTGKVTQTIGAMFAKVDWVGLGIAVGKQVPALLLGLAAGILNFDLGSVLRGIKDHWGDILLAVLAIAFAPAKIAGGLGKILTKIPFVGKFLAQSVKWLNELGGKLTSFGGDLMRSMWRGFGGISLPGVGIVARVLGWVRGVPSAIKGFFDDLGVRIGVWALDAFEAIGRGGRKAIDKLGGWLKGLGSWIVGKVGDLGRLLYNAGVAIIQGLIDGITSRAAALWSTLKGITDKIPKIKGPEDKDRILLKPAGVAIMEGLIAGIEKGEVKLKSVLEKLTDFIRKHHDKLTGLLDKRAGVIDSFKGMTSSIFGADLSVGEGEAPATIQKLLAVGAQRQAEAERLRDNVKSLIGKGLSKSLIEDLIREGANGQEQINLLAGGTTEQIAQANAQEAAKQAALVAAGMTAAGGLGINADIREEQRDIRIAKAIEDGLDRWAKKQDKNTTLSVKLSGNDLLLLINRSLRQDGKPAIP